MIYELFGGWLSNCFGIIYFIFDFVNLNDEVVLDGDGVLSMVIFE